MLINILHQRRSIYDEFDNSHVISQIYQLRSRPLELIARHAILCQPKRSKEPILAMSTSRPSETIIGSSPFLDCSSLKNHILSIESSLARYCIFFWLKSGYNLDRSICEKANQTHVMDSLTPEQLSDVRSGKCVLVLDNSNEGHLDPSSQYFVNLLELLLSELQPHDRSIIIIDQNRELTNESSCSERFNQLRRKIIFANYDYFIKKTLLEFEKMRSVGPTDCFTSCSALASLQHQYLCMIGTPRPAKVAFYYRLILSRLSDEALISYHGLNHSKADNAKDYIIKALKSPFYASLLSPPGEQITKPIEDILENLPTYTLDCGGEQDFNKLAFSIPSDSYRKTMLSVVLESDFHSEHSRMRRVTEKTVKALGMGHPVIILGNLGSAQIAKDLGFEIFDDVINPSYDSIINPVGRFNCILSLIADTADQILQDKMKFASKIYEKAKSNWERSRSGEIMATYNKSVETPLIYNIIAALLREDDELQAG